MTEVTRLPPETREPSDELKERVDELRSLVRHVKELLATYRADGVRMTQVLDRELWFVSDEEAEPFLERAGYSALLEEGDDVIHLLVDVLKPDRAA